MPAQPTPPDSRPVAFTVFSTEPLSQLCYIAKPGTAPVRLQFYPTARSRQYLYKGTDKMPLFAADTGALMAVVTLPPGIRQALLILMPENAAGTGSGRLRVLILDDSKPRQTPGTLRILNLSGLELSGTLNRRPITLPDGIDELVRVGDTAEINLRTPFHGRSYQAYVETLPAGLSGRTLLLLLPPYRSGSLEVQSRYLPETPVPAARPEGR